MKVSDFITLVRARIRDNYNLEYSDNELIGYINDAISYWSACSVANKDKLTIRALMVNPYVEVPIDFAKWAGTYPVYILNNQVISTNNNAVECKYYAFDSHISSVTDNLKYDAPTISVLLQLTCIYALNRNQFDVSTDTSLAKSLSDVLAQAKV